MNMQKELGNNISHDNIKDFLWRTLKSGQVVPGYVPTQRKRSLSSPTLDRYGHGVLRNPDPRFMALQEFCDTRADLLADPIVQLVKKVRFNVNVSRGT